MTTPRTYKTQLDRMMQWYERLNEIKNGVGNQMASLVKSDVYTFFHNACHLRDWIKNDGSLKVHPKDVDNFFDQHECMKWCVDIYNEIKPVKVQKKRIGVSAVPGKMGARQRVNLVSGRGMSHISVEILGNNGITKDAFELATEVKETWEAFLRKIL